MAAAAELPLVVDYVSALAPAGAFVAATIAAVFAGLAHRRQKRADRHQAMWTSMTWALDQLADPNDEYKVKLGMSALKNLGENRLIDRADNKLLREVNQIVADRIATADDSGTTAKDVVVMSWTASPPDPKRDFDPPEPLQDA